MFIHFVQLNIHALAPLLEQASEHFHDELDAEVDSISGYNGFDLLFIDLARSALKLAHSDGKQTASETIYFHILAAITEDGLSQDFRELWRYAQATYEQEDQQYPSIRLLRAYDKVHDTFHAGEARDIFVHFAQTIIEADDGVQPREERAMEKYLTNIYRNQPPANENDAN